MRSSHRFVLSLLLLTLLHAPAARPQALASPPGNTAKVRAFDVASIKPLAPGSPPIHSWAGVRIHPDNIELAWQSLPELLYFAFGYKSARFDGQITGLPAWADAHKYDIVGKLSPADMAEFQSASEAQRQQWCEQMVQSLLIERFHLAVHRGSKDVPVYELVVAKGGSKMTDAASDPNPPLGKADDGTLKTAIRWKKDTSIVQAYSMPRWAEFLSSPETGVGRPVIDKTGLTGTYSFPFDWSIYSAGTAVRNGVAPSHLSQDSGSSVFRALNEIGLKLQPSTAPMQTLIVDHVEEPTEN